MNDKRLAPMPKNLMFALDIGTRSVVGVISKKEDDLYRVVDHEVMPHPERAMFDGQIHDIEKVTKVVKQVVEKLEVRAGYRLEQAAIAAAGRSLKTARASSEMAIDLTREIERSIIDGLEMQCIQEAQSLLNEGVSQYYCVGYSVIGYALDGSNILNPLGHRGRTLSVEIIATFLPHIVVDSLYSVVQKAGLEVMNLTLEPIAAINVAIPKHLRLLNLALVDVGAGTSDIAISKDGAVTSYGMVASAGDRLTEALAQTYLLDFNSAEKLKLSLGNGDTQSFTDVIGLVHTLPTQDILETLSAPLQALTQSIAKTLLELNGKAPSAIFCIGGGSQIPGFTEALAEHVGLPKERVAIKTIEVLEKIKFEGEALSGPEYITPVGIGVTAFEERDQDFIQVTVNETTVRLFHSKPLQVSDALVLTGYHARSLISERGPSTVIHINGEEISYKGEYGESAKIMINGAMGALHSRINHKDHIVVIPAEPGKPRKLTLKDLISYGDVVYLNDQPVQMIHYVRVNGVHRTPDYVILEGDQVITEGILTVKDLAEAYEIDLESFHICSEGEPLFERDLLVKNQLLFTQKKPLDAREEEEPLEPIFEALNDDRFEVIKGHFSIEHTPIELVVNGSTVVLPAKKKDLVFVDIFDYIDFDLSKPQGILNLRLNGERARYTDVLKHGDVIDVQWKK